MHRLDQKLCVDRESRIPDRIANLLHLEEMPFGVDGRHPFATVVVEGDQPAAVEKRWGRGRGGGDFVAAGPADGGKDLVVSRPALERLDGGLVAAPDQAIQAGLADDGGTLVSAMGRNVRQTLLVIVQTAVCLNVRCQRGTDRSGDKPRFVVLEDDGDRKGIEMKRGWCGRAGGAAVRL